MANGKKKNTHVDGEWLLYLHTFTHLCVCVCVNMCESLTTCHTAVSNNIPAKQTATGTTSQDI